MFKTTLIHTVFVSYRLASHRLSGFLGTNHPYTQVIPLPISSEILLSFCFALTLPQVLRNRLGLLSLSFDSHVDIFFGLVES